MTPHTKESPMPPTLTEEMQALLDQTNTLQAHIKLISLPCTETHAERSLRTEMSLVHYHIAHVIDHLRIVQAIRLPDVLAATEEHPIMERGKANDQ